MIKLLGILFPFLHLFAQETSFLLPDEHSRLVHYLGKAFKDASEEILIVTPSFNHTELKKGVLESARRGVNTTLVVQNLKGDPLSLVQYERIGLFIYTPRKLQGSIVLIDGRYLCLLPFPIEEEGMQDQASLAQCTDDAARAAAVRRTLKPLLRRSEPYLK